MDKLKRITKRNIFLDDFINDEKEWDIRCDTEEKAKKLLEEFHKRGLKWHDGSSYKDNFSWFFREKTTYSTKGYIGFTPFTAKEYKDLKTYLMSKGYKEEKFANIVDFDKIIIEKGENY